MAHYTGLSNLKNKPHRSGFDVSGKRLFTAKVGEILPIYWDIALPGDSYRIPISYFTRTQPVQTSAYTRIREYFDVYEVPLRLLWKSAPNAITQMGDKNPLQSTSIKDFLSVATGLPSMPLSDISNALDRLNGGYGIQVNPTTVQTSTFGLNQFGFSRGSCANKLLTYLRYGSVLSPDSPLAATDDMWSTTVKRSTAPFSDIYAQNMFVNVLPLLSYQKIYQDFFRWDQWENADPTTYNVDYYDGAENQAFYGTLPSASDDYWKSPTMFDLRYCNFNKDLFMGVLPDSQFGEVSMVTGSLSGETPNSGTVTVSIPSNSLYGAVVSTNSATGVPAQNVANPLYLENFNPAPGSGSSPMYALTDGTNIDSGQILRWVNYNNFELTGTLQLSASQIAALKSQFSVLQLRQAEALQRWKEITQSGDYDYREQIYKHFGVSISPALSNKAIYHGGIARNLDISEIVNTNLDTAESEATIHGKGVGSGTGQFSFKVKEHSVIMVIYHAIPVMDYFTTSPDPQLVVTSSTDLPIPEMDNIGMQAISALDFFNDLSMLKAVSDYSTGSNLMGYQPRYYAWKTKIDCVMGAFTTTLPDWATPYTPELFQLMLFYGSYDGNLQPSTFANSFNYNVFKVNPSIMNSIFGVAADSTWDTDQLIVNSEIGASVVRNLSRDGVPY